VKFQNEFRSPTEYLMYPPDNAIYQRRAPSKSGGTLRNAYVIQGHIGAVYAPVSDEGAFRPEVVGQTQGQGPWHDKLREIFIGNKANADSRSGMLQILEDVTAFTKSDMWYGTDPGGVAFAEYYSKAKDKADETDTIKFDDLKARAKGASDQVSGDFARARKVVEPLLHRGS